ncbi:MAG: 5-dehydro-4-deoxy-D-glucuronate isomerase [Monoglobales bacterium]
MIFLKLVDKHGNILADTSGINVDFTFDRVYEEGDKLIVKLKDCGEFIWMKLDESLKESIVLVPDKIFEYTVPFGLELIAYDEASFKKPTHRVTLREATDEEAFGSRIISENSADRHGVGRYFPHARANFVTRNDPVFFERNAIDGVINQNGHGIYPYHSWAGGAREDLEFYIDFGAEVEVEKIDFFLRADFANDHDTYWKSIDVEFDDGQIAYGQFEKPTGGQTLMLDEPKVTKTLHFTNFKQVSYPLSFAGLSQVQVYGKYIKKELEKVEIRNASNAKDVKYYTTDRLREEFHIGSLFTKDNTRMVYSHIDRIITAGIMPVHQVMSLEGGKELASDYFLERREMGCINIGGKGIITVDGTEYVMEPRDGIYIGKGNKEITFKSLSIEEPAKFYISSCPAHKEYPTVKIDISKAKKVPCGSVEDANKRVINQYIHPEVMQSCQLAMGLTQLEVGSVWNTMPTHTHDRRMEVYLYLDMDENDVVFHMMGEPNETRHIIMHNEEAVISPSWSIHSGVGTKNYSFIWAMCGENQEFTDMDHIATRDLR